MLHAQRWPLQTGPGAVKPHLSGLSRGFGVTKCDAQQQGRQHEQDEVVVDEGRPAVDRAPLGQDERHARQRPSSDGDLGQRGRALHRCSTGAHISRQLRCLSPSAPQGSSA